MIIKNCFFSLPSLTRTFAFLFVWFSQTNCVKIDVQGRKKVITSNNDNIVERTVITIIVFFRHKSFIFSFLSLSTRDCVQVLVFVPSLSLPLEEEEREENIKKSNTKSHFFKVPSAAAVWCLPWVFRESHKICPKYTLPDHHHHHLTLLTLFGWRIHYYYIIVRNKLYRKKRKEKTCFIVVRDKTSIEELEKIDSNHSHNNSRSKVGKIVITYLCLRLLL